jgi:uncharacterized membrane protein
MKTVELGGAGKSVAFENFDLDNMLNLMQDKDRRGQVMTKKILLAGETFIISQSVAIGYDNLTSTSRANGATYFLEALKGSAYEVLQLPSDQCEAEFPTSMEALNEYNAVILSDIGALSLLFTVNCRNGRPGVNRLALLNEWVGNGGSIMMAGGYNSYQGMFGTARFHETPLEECLPVDCLPYSDGLEAPEGLQPIISAPHAITSQLQPDLPPVLGLNKVKMKSSSDSQLLLEVPYRGKTYPLLAVREFGRGRSLAWMTDIGPHWMSKAFVEHADYAQLMRSLMAWLCRDL